MEIFVKFAMNRGGNEMGTSLTITFPSSK